MGLGAETIEVFAEGPYRRAEEMRLRDLRRIQALVELSRCGVPESALWWVANACGTHDVFEAVAEREITVAEGGWVLGLLRSKLPWYLRIALWLYGRSLRHKSADQGEK